MEYEAHYYNLTDEKDRWDGFPLKNLAGYLQKNFRQGAKILDLGCGTGDVLKFLPKEIDYTGLDRSEFAVEKAKKNWAGYKNVRFLAYDKPELSYGNMSFDAVLLLFSLEHLKFPKKMLVECARVLRKGGVLIILAPNLEFPFARPNALRHKKSSYRVLFTILRIGDYIKRIAGIYSFRVLSGNITSEKGIYERKDDDLWHMVSSWEVIKFLESNGLAIQEFWEEGELSGWRKLLTFFPTLHWYGMTLATVFKKQ